MLGFGVPKNSPSLATRFRGSSSPVWLLGPAFVAGVAYLDPGNVASNMTAGARYGYLLVWVVVVANAMAWLIQYLSAKLGIVTGRSLPELLGERIKNRWMRRAYWLQAELGDVPWGGVVLGLECHVVDVVSHRAMVR